MDRDEWVQACAARFGEMIDELAFKIQASYPAESSTDVGQIIQAAFEFALEHSDWS